MKSLALLALLVFAIGVISTNDVFAEPLDIVNTSVSNYTGHSATVHITWNHDSSAENYKIGCVSCNPNVVDFTTGNNMTINHVTPFPNGSYALLYVISYDYQNIIINAKQLIVNLNQ
ncbi:hypothetical protein NKOR_09760 [Candidatus Nitrosopumilus koreensis AR1]|uniref:Uncharacterized protein n=1 Tax=Candidatus Nitrosopumilus koreensis AR1 TaxID=1229908 RepID=K0B9N9_9ARCH|nr:MULTISPECIES: hypothetical protein [Nitrosopumilus]AFS81797.1 hypothetical protein NKOR_09760 [Candidatus Nitrosopumilus koreensis AR1]